MMADAGAGRAHVATNAIAARTTTRLLIVRSCSYEPVSVKWRV
jgi:hypothetical protein